MYSQSKKHSTLNAFFTGDVRLAANRKSTAFRVFAGMASLKRPYFGTNDFRPGTTMPELISRAICAAMAFASEYIPPDCSSTNDPLLSWPAVCTICRLEGLTRMTL